MLEKNKQKLERVNEILKSEKLKVDEKTLALCRDHDKLKDFMNMIEKEFNSELLRLESKSLDLKFRLESCVSENNQLLEKVYKAKFNLIQNMRWNTSLEALN